MERIEEPNLMEPLLPAEGTRVLEDLAIELDRPSAKLAGKFSTETIHAISKLVRSMNCYYSNLIEGHNTHPVDIEKALKGDYSNDTKKRNLQTEAHAHIAVQTLIEESGNKPKNVVSTEYITWLHAEFCQRLPEDLLISFDSTTNKNVRIVPGMLRDDEVMIGAHLAPIASEIPRFLELFEKRYNLDSLSAVMQILAVGASHHRLLWIHPFFDGNGRVARLFSHALLIEIGIGSGLWSVSRGLARNVNEYKRRLASADGWRKHDTDGRGSLSLGALNEFCEFFLRICIDQVDFMSTLLEPSALIEKVQKYSYEQIESKKLPKGSFELLRELILTGSVPRSKISSITGFQERHNRKITKAFTEKGLVKSVSPKAPLELNIPHEVVESWFPKLYPSN